MRKSLKRIAIPTLMLILLTACAQETAVPPAKTKPPATQPGQDPVTDQPTNNQHAYAYTAPLTGLGTNQATDHRPIMVMVNNAPPARPQSGLDKADIVYELLAEGEMTRFVAIYQSQQPKVIGPVRSIRPYFIQLGAGFDAVMIHAGGSPEALETLAHSNYNAVNEISNAKYFWREKFRKMPHNLYTDLAHIENAIADKGMSDRSELPFLPFLPADSLITTGDKAETIKVTYHSLNKASYQYDTQTKRYLRFTQGKPHTDLVTKKQLAVTNLLVISAQHKILDKEGRREVDIDGPGEGYLFQQGRAQRVSWKRVNGVIRAYSAIDQTEMPLLPGNTWINVLPDNPGLASELSFQ